MAAVYLPGPHRSQLWTRSFSLATASPLAAAAAVIGGVVALLVASASGDTLPRENGVAFGCFDGREEGRLSQTCPGENTVSVAWAASRRAGDRARIPTDEHGSISSGQLVGCR